MQLSRIFKIDLKPHKNIHQNCRGAEGEDLGVGHINKVSLAFYSHIYISYTFLQEQLGLLWFKGGVFGRKQCRLDGEGGKA